MNKPIFKDFAEYWYYTKSLNDRQRKILHSSLPADQKKQLEKSYKEGGWEDLFVRNRLDDILESFKKEHDFDLLDIKIMIMKGKKVYVKKEFWEQIKSKFRGFSNKHLQYIFSGYDVVKSENNEDEYQLVKIKEK